MSEFANLLENLLKVLKYLFVVRRAIPTAGNATELTTLSSTLVQVEETWGMAARLARANS